METFSVRSSGDGMECLSHKSSENVKKATHDNIKTHGNKQHLPMTNITPGSFKSHSNIKEPKFVPYEPYKAAVTPMTPGIAKNVHVKSLKNICGLNSHLPLKKKTTIFEEVQLKPCKCVEENKKLEDELAKIKEEKKQLENQLKIQTQVNKELKKLLVASMGEDMQAKVQYLTEDKTKLAHDILTYSEKLMEETEAIEKLSIQCDVWRSKYLASSLIVDELAGWKAVLGHHLSEAVETMKVLLHDLDSCSMQCATESHFHKLRNDDNQCCEHNNFSENSKESKKGQLSAEIHNLVSSLYLNHTHSTTDQESSQLKKIFDIRHYRRGQVMNKLTSLTTVLTILNNEGHLPFDNWRSIAGRYNITSRFHPCTRYEGFTYNCGHCKGDIMIL